MCSLQQMQSEESVAVCRKGAVDGIPSEQLLPGRTERSSVFLKLFGSEMF